MSQETDLNERLAELRGWKYDERVGRWMNEIGLRWFDSVPNIAGNDHEALDAAKWMKERGYYFSVGFQPKIILFESEREGCWASFWKDEVDVFRSHNQTTLSLAIAKAMAKALQSEVKK